LLRLLVSACRLQGGGSAKGHIKKPDPKIGEVMLKQLAGCELGSGWDRNKDEGCIDHPGVVRHRESVVRLSTGGRGPRPERNVYAVKSKKVQPCLRRLVSTRIAQIRAAICSNSLPTRGRFNRQRPGPAQGLVCEARRGTPRQPRLKQFQRSRQGSRTVPSLRSTPIRTDGQPTRV